MISKSCKQTFRVFGFTDEHAKFDIEFSTFTAAAKQALTIRRNLGIAYIDGVSDQVRRKLELGR